jgi:acyl-CoA hydrolase
MGKNMNAMKPNAKSTRDSLVIKSELLLPNDTNTLNNLVGGQLMHWMDIAGGICAHRHAGANIVTASVDNISFRQPIGLGSIVILKAQVTRAFQTSMEVYIEVWAEHITKGLNYQSNTAFFTFVALDDQGLPVSVPELIPETERERELYDGALRRRQLRLVLAGRMKPEEANELKSIFNL